MRIRVKVCGITDYEDAALALDYGADALGFNFYRPSPRYIDPAEVRGILRRLPPLRVAVGVMVNLAAEDAARIGHEAGLQMLQLHGEESPEYCRGLSGWSLIKALRLGNEPLTVDPADYPVAALLLDARDEVLYGGTGKTFDWSWVERIGRARPLFLAGGLTPDNVGRAIRTVRPYAVDVCSGIEMTPGKKDRSKLKAFIDEVNHVASETNL